MIAVYIITPIVMVVVIILLVKTFGHRYPTQVEREKARNKKKQEETERLIRWIKEHPEEDKKIREELFNQPYMKDLIKNIPFKTSQKTSQKNK